METRKTLTAGQVTELSKRSDAEKPTAWQLSRLIDDSYAVAVIEDRPRDGVVVVKLNLRLTGSRAGSTAYLKLTEADWDSLALSAEMRQMAASR